MMGRKPMIPVVFEALDIGPACGRRRGKRALHAPLGQAAVGVVAQPFVFLRVAHGGQSVALPCQASKQRGPAIARRDPYRPSMFIIVVEPFIAVGETPQGRPAKAVEAGFFSATACRMPGFAPSLRIEIEVQAGPARGVGDQALHGA